LQLSFHFLFVLRIGTNGGRGGGGGADPILGNYMEDDDGSVRERTKIEENGIRVRIY